MPKQVTGHFQADSMADERLQFMGASSAYFAMGRSDHAVLYHTVRSLCRGKRVLDVACGDGYGSALLAESGATEVVGIDVSSEAIAVAQQMFARPGIRFLQGDACRLFEVLDDAPGFDLIVSFETVEDVTDLPALLEGIRRYRALNGMVVISCLSGHVEKDDNPCHLRRYTFDEFRDTTTAILGPASSWLFGTPIHGALLYPANAPMASDQERRMPPLAEYPELEHTAALPSQPSIASQSTVCKFYVGCWGGAIPEDAAVSPQYPPASGEPWRVIAWPKQEPCNTVNAETWLGELRLQISTLQGQLENLQIAKAAVDTQLAELRRRMLVRTRAAEADLQRATAELEYWRAFRGSRTYRLVEAYVSCYSLPLLGPVLRRARRVTRAVLHGAARTRRRFM